MGRDWRVGAATAALGLGWTVAALLTLLALLLLAHGVAVPECVSYDREGQLAARLGFGITAALLATTWTVAVLGLRASGTRALARLALALALPAALVAAFVAGSGITDALVDRAALSSDSAMCW